MVANISSHKRGWDDRWEYFSDWAEKGKAIQERLLKLVDEDTDAFNRIMAAFGLPKSTAGEQEIRSRAIAEATVGAIAVPLEVMETAFRGYEVAEAMIENGNPNSVTDAGVGVLAIHAAIEGAWMNVLVNAGDVKEHDEVKEMLAAGRKFKDESDETRKRLTGLVYNRMQRLSPPSEFLLFCPEMVYRMM
jgi:glutamate formiminotransferase / formiminotetrahydrofolate cyclodeaminase